MAKRFKLKLFRVILSLQSCCNKDDSTLPSNPVPSFVRLSPPSSVNANSSSKAHDHSFSSTSVRRHLSSAFTSVKCGAFSSKSDITATITTTDRCNSYLSAPDGRRSALPPPPEFHWEKEEKWHVVAKIFDDDTTPRQKLYNSSVSGHSDLDNNMKKQNDDVFLTPNMKKKQKRRAKTEKTIRIRISSSSAAAAADDDDSGLFTSEGFDDKLDDTNEEEEETKTWVSSSRSCFSTDSMLEQSPFNWRRSRKKYNDYYNNQKYTRSRKAPNKARGRRRKDPDHDHQLMLSAGKVRESFAVVKRSEDPREDFKRSMMEMIVEKQMFEERDLEQLLVCFLSLNSFHHHGLIVQAFVDIWEALFTGRRRASISHSYHVSRPT